MRLGISITSRHADVDDRTAVRWVIERAEAAADAELDHLSLGDHHSTGSSALYVQNVPMLGRAMAAWPTDRQAGLLLLIPLWHPVLAAEQIGTLAAMSDVPFIVQTGIGAGAGQFAAMGASLRTRGAVTDRRIGIIDRLLRGERVDSPDDDIVGAQIRPRPPHAVEWWIGAGTANAAIDRAARRGTAWYVSPGLDGDLLRDTSDRYRDACHRYGTTPRIVLRRDVLVGEDHEATAATARAVIEAGYRSMGSQIISGDPQHVAARMSAFAEVGVHDIVARTIAVDQPTAVRSIQLLGEVRRLLGPASGG